MSKVKRWGGSLLLAASLAAGLTACQPLLNAGISISVNAENELLVGFCHDPMKVTQVRVYVDSEDGERIDEAIGRGVTHLQPGQVLVVRKDSEGIAFEGLGELHLTPRNDVEVAIFEAFGEEARAASGVFRIPNGGLRPGRWLFADGSGSDRVCGAYE